MLSHHPEVYLGDTSALKSPHCSARGKDKLFRRCQEKPRKWRKRTLWVFQAPTDMKPLALRGGCPDFTKGPSLLGEFYGISRGFLRYKHINKKERIKIRICLGSEGFFYEAFLKVLDGDRPGSPRNTLHSAFDLGFDLSHQVRCINGN